MGRHAYSAPIVLFVFLLVLGIWMMGGSPQPASAEENSGIDPGLEAELAVPDTSTVQANVSVAQILDLAQTARTRWTTVRVEGQSGLDANLAPFVIEVGLDGYICRDGGVTLRSDGATCWLSDAASTQIVQWPAHALDEKQMSDAAAKNAENATIDSALPRAGEEPVFGNPLSDVIHPAYFVRKELGQEASQIQYLGLETVAGRKAFHLKVSFPPDVAKEKDWDVYIDRQTGIMSGLVVNPLPGNPIYEQMVTSITVDPQFEKGHFLYQVPDGYTVSSPAETVR